jgi:putative ATPase
MVARILAARSRRVYLAYARSVSEQPDLFAGEPAPAARPLAEPGRLPDAPLASRLRPARFEDLVGQEHAVSVLRSLAESGRLPSIVLWGPPGSGKTTLAQVVAGATGARFVQISAVTSGVADLRRVVAEAQQARKAGRRTVLFVDELHRFNKAQQDAILPHVEDGTFTLIGATTENPSFEVVTPLLSRSRVFRLEALGAGDLEAIVRRGLAELGVTASPEALAFVVEAARGDARVALNAVETAAALAGGGELGRAHVEQALQERHLHYDRAGDQHYDMASAMIKSIRGSDPDAAVYWMARMLEAGEDVNFVARRLVISAAEDIGLADPHGLPLAVAAQQAAHFVGLPEAVIPLSEAAVYLARAPKSNASYRAYAAAREAIQRTGNLPVPLHLRNAPTRLMKEFGHGRGYRYAHDYEGGVVEQQHLPDDLKDERFYHPTERDRPGPDPASQ